MTETPPSEQSLEHTPSSSSSSSSFPGLLENETELTIPHFWRSTKPRQCVRSEIRVFQGVQFRLLVWPQGSKQTNPNYLSAFVEVVPCSSWPSDWLIPSVSYRISIMNHKQKWIYAKADTWSFSYVCPDRGWHTLLDTRYVNRRDGYLSPDGSLTIRASILPRFSSPISVLPYSSLASTAAGGLGQEHIIALVTLLHAIPHFRKFIYSLNTTTTLTTTTTTNTTTTSSSTNSSSTQSSKSSSGSLEELIMMEKELDGVCQDLRGLMETVTAKKPPSTSAAAGVGESITSRMFRTSGSEAAAESLRSRHLKSLVVCDQLAEVIDEIAKSPSIAASHASSAAMGGIGAMVGEGWREILKKIKSRLQYGEVFKKLFVFEGGQRGRRLTEMLQRGFGVLDVVEEDRWKILEKVSLEISRSLLNIGGDVFSTPATPEQVFAQVLATLRSEISENDRKFLDDMFLGSLASMGDEQSVGPEGVGDEQSSEFESIIIQNGRSTNVEKILASGRQTVETRSLVLAGEGETNRKFERKPKVVWMTVANKIKDRLDVNESLEISGEKFRLHGFVVGHGGNGSDSSYAGNFQHYSVIMRRGRKAPWTRIEENEISIVEAVKTTANSQTTPIAWVFSPEFPVAAMLWVREAEEDLLFERGVDVRHVNRRLVPIEYWSPSVVVSPVAVVVAGEGIVGPGTSASGQITVTFVTERDLLAPVGFFSVFKNALSLTLGGVEAGRRKLLVRKDITVTRLCDAVEQFFKIPASLVRLYALHYFADVQQERFEVMAETRSVASYLSQHPVPGNFSTPTPSLVVLVTRRPEIPASITLWVKYLDTQSLGLVSGGLLTVDVSQSFSSYFQVVEKKFPSVRRTNTPGPSTLAVFEEFGPRLVEKKREKIPIADENLTDGDVVIFADLSVLSRPKMSPKEISKSASAVSWVEQLLPLFLKRKKQEISDKRTRFLDVLLNDDEDDDTSDDDLDEDEEISDHSKKPKISDEQSETSEAELSRQRLLRYLREAHRHLKLDAYDQKSSGCFLCGGSGESAHVSLVCSQRCVPEQISVHLLCLADLMGDGRPVDCVLTPNCTGHLESGNFFKKKFPTPLPQPPVTAPEQISDSIRLRFLAACPPPVQPPKRAPPRGFVPPPLPALPSPAASAAGGSARKRKKGEASEADKALWWEACRSVWNGDLEIANEFILAAEVAGQPRADDTAAFLFFHWKTQLTKPIAPVLATIPTSAPAPSASAAPAAQASAATNSKKKKVKAEVPTTATNTPVVVAAPIAETADAEPGVLQEDWQPVQRQKTPKTVVSVTASSPAAAPAAAAPVPVAAPPAKALVPAPPQAALPTEADISKSEVSSAVKQAVAKGLWSAEEPWGDALGGPAAVESARGALLGDTLRQFCLPGPLVFVFAQSGEFPARTMTAVAPTSASADEQIEALLGAAAHCDAKVERAFAAPAQHERVRWFVELDSEEEVTRVIDHMKENLGIWENLDRGTLVEIL